DLVERDIDGSINLFGLQIQYSGIVIGDAVPDDLVQLDLVAFPVVRVFYQSNAALLVPLLQLEGPGPHRVAAERVPSGFDRGLRYYAGREHGQGREHRSRRFGQDKLNLIVAWRLDVLDRLEHGAHYRTVIVADPFQA